MDSLNACLLERFGNSYPALSQSTPKSPQQPPVLRRRLPHALTLCLVLVLMSGCVYLRLLRFKYQLHEFDRHVVVDRSAGLSLKFPKPVVRDKDFIFITDSNPTSVRTFSSEPKIEEWEWRFEKKQSERNGDPFHIVFSTRFEDSLLTEITFDPQLFEAIPEDFIVELFKSLGDAKINKLRKSATAALGRDALENVDLPSMSQISDIMGKPTDRQSEGELGLFNYVFNFYNPQNRDLSGQFAIVFKTDSENLDHEIAGFELTGKGR